MDRVLIDDYSKLVKKMREKRALTQEDLGKKISEPESIVHKIESGHFRPPFRMVRKLERELKVRLTKRVDEDGNEKKEVRPKKKTGNVVIEKKTKKKKVGINAGMTIGDLLKFR